MTTSGPVHIQNYRSPYGELALASFGDRLCLCDWQGKPCAERNKRRLARLLHTGFLERTSDVIRQTEQQLDEYFAGKRRCFDIPLLPVGTSFQQSVWKVLHGIPYGETRTYKDIALRANNPKGIRAVAQAIGANGIGIIIPCHRIVGSNQSLTGFAGGLEAKKKLLELESRGLSPQEAQCLQGMCKDIALVRTDG